MTEASTTLPKAKPITKAAERRETMRNGIWPDSKIHVWRGPAEMGYCPMPRTMPLILGLLSDPKVVGKLNAAMVYLELWSRDMGQGVVEMKDAEEHAFAAGYTSKRAVRSWRERIEVLAKIGFIRVSEVGNRKIGAVLMIHPTIAVQKLRLREDNVVEDRWWNAYVSRKAEVKEPSYEELMAERG